MPAGGNPGFLFLDLCFDVNTSIIQYMNSDLVNEAAKLGFKVYPRGENYLVYFYAKSLGIRTPRQIRKMLRKYSKAATKPRIACYTPRPGCPCCDFPNKIVKQFDTKAWSRANKYDEDRDNS